MGTEHELNVFGLRTGRSRVSQFCAQPVDHRTRACWLPSQRGDQPFTTLQPSEGKK